MIKIRPVWDSSSNEALEIWILFDSMIEQIDLRGKLRENHSEIKDASVGLYEFLFDGKTLREGCLKKLLRTRTDYDTLKKEKLFFFPNDCKKGWGKIKECFDYNKFAKRNDFGKLVQMMGVTTCPYCNRSFTSTVKKSSGMLRRHNQIDHYMSQAYYPYLALTLPNMIPVCANCNQKKSTRKDVLYPYQEGFDDKYHFITHPVSGCGYLIGEQDSENDFCIAIEKIPGSLCTEEFQKRVENAREFFSLDELYNSHREYVRRIFEQRYIFGDDYIDDLMKNIPGYFKSKEQIRQILYLKSIHPNEYIDSPLSKLTHDIDDEINRLTSR